MTGTERCRLLVIGKAAKPRCFKGVRTLPVDYASNRKTWMTSDIFRDWIRKLDRKFASSNCKVLFLVDQCSAHMDVPALSAIHLAYLPANMTSVLQPMDQGIIKNVNVLYRKHLIERMILCMDKSSQYEASLISAIHMLARAWGCVKNETIANCFRACGFVANSSGEASCPPVEMRSELDDSIVDAALGDSSFDVVLGDPCFEDYVAVDSTVKTCGALTDSEIVQIVRPHESVHQSDDEDDIESKPQPKAADVAAGLALAQRFFTWENNAKEALGHIYAFQNLLSTARFGKQKQTKMTDYFS